MTHEEFMGFRPGDPFVLSDEDRRIIEASGAWQRRQRAERANAALATAVAGLRNELASTRFGRWLLRVLKRPV